jgi:hypothetical protein
MRKTIFFIAAATVIIDCLVIVPNIAAPVEARVPATAVKADCTRWWSLAPGCLREVMHAPAEARPASIPAKEAQAR